MGSHRSDRRRRLGLVVLGALTLVLLRATAALAFWGNGDGSDPAEARAAILSPPSAASASTLGGGALEVSWVPASPQLSGAQYQVVRTSGLGSPHTVCTESAPVTSCTDSGLLPGTTYGYQVRALLHTWQSPVVATSGTTAVPTFAIALDATTTEAGLAVEVLSVTAKVAGLTDATYEGGKTLIWSGLAYSPAGLEPTYPGTAVTFVDGVATSPVGFIPSSVVPFAAGSSNLTATDATSTAVTGGVTLTVTHAPAATLRFATQPAGSLAGVQLPTQPVVAVEDAYGNLVLDNTDMVQVTLSTGTFANGSATANATAVAGVASFTGLQINVTGSYTLLATDLTDPPVIESPSASFTISPGTGSTLVFEQQVPASTVAGQSMTPAPSVRIFDQFGNTTTRDTTVTLSALTNSCRGDPGLSGHSVPAVNGLATFSALQLTKSCTGYVLRASDGAATVDSAAFAIDPAAASVLVFLNEAFTGVNSATANVGPITVQQRDVFGNVAPANVAGTTVTLSQSSGSGVGAFAETLLGTTLSQVTIPAGSSTVSFYFGSSEPGAKEITASRSGFSSDTLTGTTVAAGLGLTNLAFLVGPGSTGAPTLSCDAVGPNRNCTVTGLGTSGLVVFNVRFTTEAGPFSYSASPSTINIAGPFTGSTIIAGGATTSSTALAASHTTAPQTSVLTFAQGGYTLNITVSS
ncbi:MAG: hypothetical protein ACKV2O_01700 [Acidimicrobiales bacterium]